MMTYNTLVVLLGVGLLGAGAGSVGSFAVLRRRALLGDALAHAALPGLPSASRRRWSEPTAMLLGAGDRTARSRGRVRVASPHPGPGGRGDRNCAERFLRRRHRSQPAHSKFHVGGREQSRPDSYILGKTAGMVATDPR